MQPFRTHTGSIVAGDDLTAAYAQVADDWTAMARAIRCEDHYASHVTEAAKERYLARDLEFSESIRRGEPHGFTIWQRVNAALTGECVALLA